MAVSSSSDFNLTAVDLVTEARRKIGIHETEEPLSAAETTAGLTMLNALLKAWQVGGVSFSHYTQGSFALVASDVDYVFGAGGTFTTVPFDIIDVRLTRSSIDRVMTELSREEYYAIPNKTVTGVPTSWFYDRQRNGGTMYVWPAPDSTGGTIKFTYVRKIWDMDANADDLDLPQEWYEAVIYGLADRMAENYGLINTPLGQRVSEKALASLQEIKDFDTAEGMGSIRIRPNRTGYFGGYRR